MDRMQPEILIRSLAILASRSAALLPDGTRGSQVCGGQLVLVNVAGGGIDSE